MNNHSTFDSSRISGKGNSEIAKVQFCLRLDRFAVERILRLWFAHFIRFEITHTLKIFLKVCHRIHSIVLLCLMLCRFIGKRFYVFHRHRESETTSCTFERLNFDVTFQSLTNLVAETKSEAVSFRIEELAFSVFCFEIRLEDFEYFFL